jgi:hypothetical protein
VILFKLYTEAKKQNRGKKILEMIESRIELISPNALQQGVEWETASKEGGITLNMLDLVPQFRRHVHQYLNDDETDSEIAAYLSDSVEALAFRWSRTYEITFTAPLTFEVTPDIAPKDKDQLY